MLAEMYVDMTKDAAEKLSVIKTAGMLDKTNTTGDGGVSYKIVGPFTDNNGIQYDSAVLLDTQFFDDFSPRDWGDRLKEFVEFRAGTDPFIMPIVDEKGNAQHLVFAKPNSQLNWAGDLGMITSKDVAIFERTINNEIFRGKKPQTANGEYVIDTGKCLMFTDGDFHSPTLSRVIVFETEYESLTADAKEMIREDAKITRDLHATLAAIENMFGEEFAVEYTPPIYRTNARKNRGGKGTNSPGGYQGYRAKSVRERLIEDGYAHLLDDGDTGNKLPGGISSRVALVDALEGLARRDEEKRLLNTYRTYMKNAQADQERLVKTRKEIAKQHPIDTCWDKKNLHISVEVCVRVTRLPR